MMNPLYIFYLVNRDVFDPEMEGTQYGYRLFATSAFSTQITNIYPAIPEVILIWLYQMVRQQWYSVIR